MGDTERLVVGVRETLMLALMETQDEDVSVMLRELLGESDERPLAVTDSVTLRDGVVDGLCDTDKLAVDERVSLTEGVVETQNEGVSVTLSELLALNDERPLVDTVSVTQEEGDVDGLREGLRDADDDRVVLMDELADTQKVEDSVPLTELLALRDD